MKKAIVALLAGVLCMGCFAACDTNESAKDDGKQTGGETITGEPLDGEVTAEEWVSKLEGLDLHKYAADVLCEGRTEYSTQKITANILLDENKLKCYYYNVEEGDNFKNKDEFTAYAIKANGAIYSCGEEDGEYHDWGVVNDRAIAGLLENNSMIKLIATGDKGEELPGLKTLSEIVETAKVTMSEYTYDTQKQRYYTVSEEKPYGYDSGTTYTVRVELEFSKGEVYIRQIVSLFGSAEGYMQESWSFENVVVNLPEEDKLDLWLNGMVDGTCDECKETKTTHYYDGSQGNIEKGEYCNACAHEKDPTIFTDGKCDDCGTSENLYYCDGSATYHGVEGEYCSSCGAKRMLENMLGGL